MKLPRPDRRGPYGFFAPGLGLLVLLLGSGLLSMATGPGAQDQDASSLRLMLESSKTTVVLGEPVYVTVELMNTGSETVWVFPDLSLLVQVAALEVTRPDGRTVTFVPLAIEDVDQGLEELPPGGRINATYPIFYGGSGWTFDQPGTYGISAVYHHRAVASGTALRSDSLGMTIRREAGAGDLLMQGGKASQEAGKYLTWQAGDHLRAGIALLQDVATNYPSSALADYARLARGESFSRGFRDYSIGRVRQPDCTEALAELRAVRVDNLPAFLRLKKALAEARCHIYMEQPDLARAPARQASKLAGEHPGFRSLIDAAVSLQPDLAKLIR